MKLQLQSFKRRPSDAIITKWLLHVVLCASDYLTTRIYENYSIETFFDRTVCNYSNEIQVTQTSLKGANLAHLISKIQPALWFIVKIFEFWKCIKKKGFKKHQKTYLNYCLSIPGFLVLFLTHCWKYAWKEDIWSIRYVVLMLKI